MIEPYIVEGPGFRVLFEVHPGYLRAYVHEGEDSLAVSKAMWTMLGAQCRAHSVQRLLVLEDLSGTVGEADVPEVIRTMIEAGFRGIRTAFVELQGHHQVNEQGEILGMEHGLAVHLSNNEHAARHWLLYGDE